MKRAWLLPGERMPVGRPAAPQIRLRRMEEWLASLGYGPRVLFRARLRPSGGSGRGTGRTLLDAFLTLAAAPWLALRALYERPALILSASAMNAPVVALIKRLQGDRVVVVVDLIGIRSLESDQTTRSAGLRRIFSFAWRRLERASFKAADLVLTVNERSADLVGETSPGTRVAVLRDAAEEELASTEPADRRAYGIPADAVVVGFVGSIVCARLDTLISAWEALQRDDGPKLHLVIVGNGPDLPEYRRRAAGELADTVTFTGPLARDEALAVLRACDIAYTGSWSRAGFSFKLFEYLALGMPILAERKPQMSEVLTDGSDAVLYEGVSELVAKINELASDPQLRASLGPAARRTFLGGHTVERRRERFKELLRDAGARRPLHLLEVGLSWPPETFVGWRLRALAERGVRVTVAGLPRNRQKPLPHIDGVEFKPMAPWNDSRPRKLLDLIRHSAPLLLADPGRFIRVAQAARQSLPASRPGTLALLDRVRTFAALARLRPDLVHFDWETAAITFLPMWNVWGSPVIMSCHGAGVNRHPFDERWGDRLRLGLPIAFGRAAAIHCVADQVARQAVHWGADPDSIWVIRSAVDPHFFAPRNGGAPRRDACRLVGIARLVPSKGHEDALAAIALLRDAGVPVEYDIFGGEPETGMVDPSDRNRIRAMIEELGLEDQIRLRGIVSSSEIRDALHDSDMLIHTSRSDGLPTVIVEAMSCAVPVVVTDVGGVSELVSDGIEGFVVPPREPASVAAAVERLWADPELRGRMGQAGRARVEEEFVMDRLADRFVEMLESVARGADA